jgi:hypothetical protein
LVGHSKIHICKIAFIEKYPSQRNIINLGVLKITIKEIAINEGYGFKSTVSKIAIVESAIFKIFVFGVVVVKNFVSKFLI